MSHSIFGLRYLKILSITLGVLIVIDSPFAQQTEIDKQSHSVFLIGDAGEPKKAPENLIILKKQLEAAGKNSTLIFLGDNIYSHGLPDKNDPERKKYEEKLTRQLEITKNYKGRTFIIPGNHDWAKGRKYGWQQILNEGEFVTEYMNDEDVFQPKSAGPGPIEIELTPNLYLIILDLQWFLQAHDKPIPENMTEQQASAAVLADFGELMKKHINHHVIVAAHHPLYSYGSHGGKFPLKEHIFPLTAANENLYIPLPIIGSIYPLFRATAGNIQDIAHPKYKALRIAIEPFLQRHPNAIYVAGHEHSLQHIVKEGVNYVVSGSGSKTTYVKQGKYAKFAESKTGFAKVIYNNSGESTLEMWTPENGIPEGKKAYEALLYKQKVVKKSLTKTPILDFSDSTINTMASLQYEATKGQKRMMGMNYRDVWKQTLDIEVFNFSKEKGGLKIVQRGGGMQTNSLRLQAKDGKQYVLRSVQKFPEKAIPPGLKKTFAVDLVQDQISASHPYGALIVPFLAEAIGIYHTNPKVVYIPDDGALGPHQKTFANTLAIFEERPAKDWSDADFFGNSKDIESSAKVFKKVKKDNDNRVDEPFVLKSRLFDMIIADWDRHEDQWRWASFDEEKGKMYRPIPRDRDQAFFVNEGVLPKIASRKWAVPKVEGFNEDVRWSPGINFNARFLDRLYLTSLSRNEWIEKIEEVKEKLTDEVIESAVKKWPSEIYKLTGERTISILKSRRDNLRSYALELYDFLSKEVEIRGSDKNELFEIEKLNEQEVRISAKKISKKGVIRNTLFDRTFLASETKKIRVFGFDGKDQFIIKGEAKSKIKISIIGGDGKDHVEDQSIVKTSRRIKYLDNKNTETSLDNSNLKLKLSDDVAINKYEKNSYKYDVLFPLLSFQFNKDDGLFVGGGGMFLDNEWRKKPVASKHSLTGNMAFATQAFNIKYIGEFTEVLGKWNVGVLADIKRPFSVNNFFGLGNESIFDIENQGIDFYRVRFEDNLYRITLSKKLGDLGKFTIGPQHLAVEIQEQPNKFITDGIHAVDKTDLFDTRRLYTGLHAALEFDSRNNKQLTTRGMYFLNEVNLSKGWNEHSSNIKQFRSEVSFYYSFQFPAIVTLASRTGFSHNLGSFEFYNGSILGGRTNLRGFRRTRFYGNTSFYQNTDLRIKLFDFQSYLFPGQFGIVGFYDVGRVWLDGESSDIWHDSKGVGIWLAPLSKAVISFSVAFNEEENLPFLSVGFFF